MANDSSENVDSSAIKDANTTTRPISYSPRYGRNHRRMFIYVGITIACIVALAVGLGVGLTFGRKGSSSSSSTSTPDPVPTNPTIPTNSSIWQPAIKSTWQIVLQDPIQITSENTTTSPDVEIWDIDLFTNSRDSIRLLQSLNKKVLCYFSAGSYEPYRPDSADFKASDKGHAMKGWPDEKWLDIRSQNVRAIMDARIALAKDKGCDAIDPDNVDGYNNNNGLSLTQDDSISFMAFLADAAISRNISIGLKNAGEILPNLTGVVQFSINEQCVEYDECNAFAPMITVGKPVFHIEYPTGAPGDVSVKTLDDTCATTGDGARSEDFSTVLKGLDLDRWVQYCDGSNANTTLLD